MNIFENYLIEINDIILGNKDILNLENLENLNNINLEVPPDHFDFDLSTNVSLVLAKKKNQSQLFSKFYKGFVIKKDKSF